MVYHCKLEQTPVNKREKKITPNNWFHDINTTEQTKQKDPILQTDWNFLNSTRISLFKSYAAKNITEKFTNLRLDSNDDFTRVDESYVTTTNKKNFTSRTNLTHADDRLRFTLPTISLFSFSLFLYKKATRNSRKSWKQH